MPRAKNRSGRVTCVLCNSRMFIETKLQSANSERIQNPYTGGKLPIKPIKPQEPKVPSTGMPNPMSHGEVPENKLSERLKEIQNVSIPIHDNRSKIVSFEFVKSVGKRIEVGQGSIINAGLGSHTRDGQTWQPALGT